MEGNTDEFNHSDDTVRLVFRKTMLSAEEPILGKQEPEEGKPVQRPLERGTWARTMWFWVEALVAIQGWDRCWNLGICWIWKRRERGIKLNMKVSDWDGWAVRGWYLTRGRDGRVRFEV